MRETISYAWVSYYACDCEKREPEDEEWKAVMEKLRQLFPFAKVGFGECGAGKDPSVDEHEKIIRRYYNKRIDLDYFVGGCFFWYGSQYMVPEGEPLWRVLNDI